MEVRPIDANALMKKLKNLLNDFDKSPTKKFVVRTILSMLRKEKVVYTVKTVVNSERLLMMIIIAISIKDIVKMNTMVRCILKPVFRDNSLKLNSICIGEKQAYWKQPYFEGMPNLYDICDGHISSNLNIGGIVDWKVKIYNYKTKQPEMKITSERVAKALFGSGFANIYVPIQFCPFCGEKLGGKENVKENDKY